MLSFQPNESLHFLFYFVLTIIRFKRKCPASASVVVGL